MKAIIITAIALIVGACADNLGPDTSSSAALLPTAPGVVVSSACEVGSYLPVADDADSVIVATGVTEEDSAAAVAFWTEQMEISTFPTGPETQAIPRPNCGWDRCGDCGGYVCTGSGGAICLWQRGTNYIVCSTRGGFKGSRCYPCYSCRYGE